jgi:hypothetical protein
MEGDIGDVADYPAIVAGRAGRYVEKGAGAEFVDGAVFHSSGGATGNDQADVLDVAARCAYQGADMERLLPTGLIGGAADGHAADTDEFKFAFSEGANLVGLFKTL